MEVMIENKLGDFNIDEYFQDDTKCLQILSKLKWANGFTCRKCANENFCDGKIPYSRRCTRCKNEESATSHTLFHNIKFPVSKAFYMAYQVCSDPKKVSTFDMAKKLDLRQMTCWNFVHKVENKIAKLTNYTNAENISFVDILTGNDDSPFI